MNDGELLQAFRTKGDQEAFAGLVSRHGRVIFSAARSVVEDTSLAEDVVQATFITLAQKATSLEKADSVVGWLCRVAVCLARNERKKSIRRTAREKEAAMLSDESGGTSEVSEGDWDAIYEELADLSEKYRQPLLLHHLEGLSYEEAAPMCGCTRATFGIRLTRGREKLRERLARRGVALGMTALVAGLGQSASAAELPAGFVASTCAAAAGGAVSAQVSALLQSALKILFWAKVKTVTAICAGVVLVGGAGVGAAVALPLLWYQESDNGTGATVSGCVYAWGGNQFGQLGDGTTNNSPKPVLAPGLDGVTAVAAGYCHTVALKGDRTAWVWGDNRYGQLGNGTTNNSVLPVAVSGLDGVIAVAAGSTHTVALKGDQTVWAWGDNSHGQLGNGTTNNSVLPVAVSGLDGVIAVAAGSTHTVAVKLDRTVWTWGKNSSGQLGDGSTTARLTPVQAKTADGAPLAGVIAVAAGFQHTVTLKDDHTVWTCGDNFYGQRGNGMNTLFGSSPAFEPVPALTGVLAIAAGKYYTLACKDDRTVWRWGAYTSMEMEKACFAPTPVMLAVDAPLANATAIAAGERHAVALLADGTLATWGKSTPVAVPVKLPDGTTLSVVTAIAAGGGHTVIVVGAREESVGVLE